MKCSILIFGHFGSTVYCDTKTNICDNEYMVNFPTVQRSDDGYYVWCTIMIPNYRHQHQPRQEQLDTWVHLITPGHRQQTADSGLAGEQFLCTISRVVAVVVMTVLNGEF